MSQSEITIWEKEIEQLEADKQNVTNNVSIEALQHQILIRQVSISNVRR